MRVSCEGILYPKDAIKDLKEKYKLEQMVRAFEHEQDKLDSEKESTDKAKSPSEALPRSEAEATDSTPEAASCLPNAEACEAQLPPMDESIDDQDLLPNSLTVYVPHASWQECKFELDHAFSLLHVLSRYYKPRQIFVLAPLHKGKIGYDDPFTLYVPEDGKLEGSDWSISLKAPLELWNEDSSSTPQATHATTEANAPMPKLCISDDVCSEEHSLEIIAPYLSLIWPEVPVSYILAPFDQHTPELPKTLPPYDEETLEPLHNAPEETKESLSQMKTFMKKLEEHYPNSLILVSNNRETDCARMWYWADYEDNTSD